MLELGPLTPAFLTLAVSEVALGSYVYARGRWSPINRLFFLFTLFAGAGSVLGMMMTGLTTEGEAVWTFRLSVLLLIMEIGAAYRLSSLVLHVSGTLNRSRSAYPLTVLSLAVFLASTVGGMDQDRYGWVASSPWPMAGVVAVLSTYMVLIALSLRRKYPGLDEVKRRQSAILSFALSFPAAFMAAMMIMVEAGAVIPRMYGVGELVAVIILAYGILRYDLLIPPRVTESAAPPSWRAPTLDRGRAYLFESQGPDRMLASVAQETREGISALIICRTHPDQLRARYRLTQTPFIWLAQSPGPNRVDPGNLQMLSHMTTKYLQKAPSLIALEGLEYLLSNNELNKVLRFLGQLRDEVIVMGSMLMVSVDPRALTDRQRAVLERELELVME